MLLAMLASKPFGEIMVLSHGSVHCVYVVTRRPVTDIAHAVLFLKSYRWGFEGLGR